MRLYPFGKFLLYIPDDHNIPGFHVDHPLYDSAYGVVWEEIGAHSSSGMILDIGANVGDTAAIMRTYLSNEIVCIEGSTEFLEYLRLNTSEIGPNITIIDKFVSSSLLRERTMSYHTSGGTGRLLATTGDNNSIKEDLFIMVDDLIKKFGSREIVLVKSDADGADGYLLIDFLDRLRTIYFFECDLKQLAIPNLSPWPNVFELLRSLEYNLILFDNRGFPMLIVECDQFRVLSDLGGYINTQHLSGKPAIYYTNVWAFPAEFGDLFQRISKRLRQRLLKPFGFK
jgi:FkbM family methyltransferase